MNRLVLLAALSGVLMTSAAFAQSTVLPVNGMCPNGYEIERGSSGSDDRCKSTSSSSGSQSLSLASMSSDGDDDHSYGGDDDHDSSGHESHDSDDHGDDHDSDDD